MSAPAWLADFQARFGEVIRTPLDRATGTLTATPDSYDPRIAQDSGAEKLAVYNRQIWFRFFDVMQSAFPLTMRLLGAWTFNDHAAKFLLANPPRGWDIDRVPDGFEKVFADDPRLERVEASRIDAAWREVFRAPEVTVFHPSAEDAASLLDSRLALSPAVAFVEEHFALIDLRKKILREPGETRVDAPPRFSPSKWWAIVRRDEGTLQVPLEAREAELLASLQTRTVRDALGVLEDSCSMEERATLPAKTRAWLARSVTLEFFSRR